MRWPHYACLFWLICAVAWLLLETVALAELAGDFERRAVLAERELDASAAAASSPEAGASPPATAAPSADDGAPLGDYSRLQLELHTTKEQLRRLREMLAVRNAELERRTAASKRRAAEALRPMPLGVRECLNALHECLRREGFTAQRFLRATSIDPDGLHGVEMLAASADGLGATFIVAERMAASIDRPSGRLELRFFDGHRSADGERAALPEDGFPVAFEDVDGEVFEARLPYLVRGQGAYPVEVVAPEREPGALDPGSRRQWAARLSRLLARSKTKLRWSVTRLRGQLEARFLQVDLVGTDAKGMVMGSAHCAKVSVEVDERRGVVSLLLQEGVLRREGVESTINAQGFRMLLPALTPKDVTDAMLGMVVRR